MKSYLVVFFVLLSFAGFGQDSSVTEVCSLRLPFPEVDYFSNTNYKQFQTLFSPEKMKANGIKTVIIKEVDNDDIPSINIRNEAITTYRLNDDGFVVHYDYGLYHFMNYQRNKENLIVAYIDSLSHNQYSYTSNSYEY